LAPVNDGTPDSLEAFYQHPNLKFIALPAFDTTSIISALLALFKIPLILIKMAWQMHKASHIHLRCPSNMGLLATFCQMLFPRKPKTVKYANNWDPASSQPLSYKLQRMILRNTFLTRNTRVLVYGDWNDVSKNIQPFYTASYSQNLKLPVTPREFMSNSPVKLLFVGTLTPNKRPLLAIEIARLLKEAGIDVELNMLGDGSQRDELAGLIDKQQLSSFVFLRGKVHPDETIQYFKNSHFLLSLSISEGWPKVVAESMWWGCLPVTTKTSCVGQMVGNGSRGVIVSPNSREIVSRIISLIQTSGIYMHMCEDAIQWSRQYYLERFDADIANFVKPQ